METEKSAAKLEQVKRERGEIVLYECPSLIVMIGPPSIAETFAERLAPEFTVSPDWSNSENVAVLERVEHAFDAGEPVVISASHRAQRRKLTALAKRKSVPAHLVFFDVAHAEWEHHATDFTQAELELAKERARTAWQKLLVEGEYIEQGFQRFSVMTPEQAEEVTRLKFV